MTFDAKDPVALTQALVRCESVTPDEGGALTLLQGILSAAGFTCHRMTFSEPGTPDVENLYARIGTAEPHLCFAGHTDVVPPGNLDAWTSPPFSAEIRDGILYGRGCVDMKGDIACFVSATLRSMAANGGVPRGSLSFLITGDEEGPSINGTMKVLDWMRARGENVSACLVGEPSNPDSARPGDQDRTPRLDQRRDRRPRPPRPFRLSAKSRQPDPEARAHHRPARLRRDRQRHGALPAVQSANHRHLGSEPHVERHPGRSPRDRQHPLQRHLEPPDHRNMAARAGRRCRRYDQRALRHRSLGHRRRLPDEPRRRTRRNARRIDRSRNRPHARAHHRRRHVRRALHQGSSARSSSSASSTKPFTPSTSTFPSPISKS